MKVLISAYSILPNSGSEKGVGWRFLKAWLEVPGSRIHLLTRKKNQESIRFALSDDENSRLTIVAHEVFILRNLKDFHIVSSSFYYFFWQLAAIPKVKKLHSVWAFEAAHHATFASNKMPCALAYCKNLRFVLGPIGGATNTPIKFWRYLGTLGILQEIVRRFFNLIFSGFGKTAVKKSSVAFALNQDTANYYSNIRTLDIWPNAFVSNFFSTDYSKIKNYSMSKIVLCVGRLVPWKGWHLALDVFSRLDKSHELMIVGKGWDLKRLKRIARRKNIERRVRFLGQLKQDDLKNLYQAAHVMLFPSFHDSCGWVVAEALELGLPVLAMDLGGPREILEKYNMPLIEHKKNHVLEQFVELARKDIKVVENFDWGQKRYNLFVRSAINKLYLR
jgi:glycosyltransferase involved in cell wall biosynthesis